MRGIQIQGWDNIRQFYTEAYKAMPSFEVEMLDLKGTTPEFCACEMRCIGGIKDQDQKVELIGVSLFTWAWEGSSPRWDGTLSAEAISPWKIVEEKIYFTVPQKAS